MRRLLFSHLAILAFIQFILGVFFSPQSQAQDWELRVKPRGTLKVVDLRHASGSLGQNYAEGLVTVDKDNKLTACLAEDWRWLNDRTIEFKLRQGVTFHNGEKFNAEAVRINWEHYKEMANPRPIGFTLLPDETVFEVIDEYTVRFIFPKPDGLVFPKFRFFFQVAPAFFSEHKFLENNWGYFEDAGPWGTGPFKLVEGSTLFGKPSDRVVLEAYESYWDPRYPKVKRVVFESKLIGDRDEAMRLCREEEGAVDIVSHIRPLDTLKVAESPYAKVVKSKDVTILQGLFNQRKQVSKWKDVRLRKTLNYAINRKELWKYAAKGNAFNLGGHIPPEAFGHNPLIEPYGYDTERARVLLQEAAYPDGFQMTIITHEAWKLETQIISKMLERVGLKVNMEVLTWPEWNRKLYVPILDKPPEEQEWDLSLGYLGDWYAHTGATFLAFFLIDQSNLRWIEYDPTYEEMWKDMASTFDLETQEEKIRLMEQYLYDQAYLLIVYSPLTLYAVNKEVNFVPQKFEMMRLKETSVTDRHWSVRDQK